MPNLDDVATIVPSALSFRVNAIRLAISVGVAPVEELLGRCTFGAPARDPIALAVSGGPDSIAMAILAKAAGHTIEIWHVDHQIRPSSSLEAQAVAEFAELAGARFHLVSQRVEPGANLEARARQLRKSRLPMGIATGHTMDDQAETLLINLLRGAGAKGLAGMRPGASKPILALRKSETEAICAALELTPIRDFSNDSAEFVRNRIRHEVLPLMADIAAREVVPILYRTSALFGEEEAELDDLAASLDAHSCAELAGAPRVLRRRRLRQAVAELVGYPPSFEALESLETLVLGRSNFRTQLSGGVDVTCKKGRISYTLARAALGGLG